MVLKVVVNLIKLLEFIDVWVRIGVECEDFMVLRELIYEDLICFCFFGLLFKDMMKLMVFEVVCKEWLGFFVSFILLFEWIF